MRHNRMPFVFWARVVPLFAPSCAANASHRSLHEFAPQSPTAFSRETRAHGRIRSKSKAAHRMVWARLRQEGLPRNPLSLSETCRVARRTGVDDGEIDAAIDGHPLDGAYL
jgi:hypothetical protein